LSGAGFGQQRRTATAAWARQAPAEPLVGCDQAFLQHITDQTRDVVYVETLHELG